MVNGVSNKWHTCVWVVNWMPCTWYGLPFPELSFNPTKTAKVSAQLDPLNHRAANQNKCCTWEVPSSHGQVTKTRVTVLASVIHVLFNGSFQNHQHTTTHYGFRARLFTRVHQGASKIQISDAVMGGWVPTSLWLGSFYIVKKLAVFPSLVHFLTRKWLFNNLWRLFSGRWSEFSRLIAGTSLAWPLNVSAYAKRYRKKTSATRFVVSCSWITVWVVSQL